MTKVAQIFEREKEEAVAAAIAQIPQEKDAAIKQAAVFKMLLKGDTVVHVSQETGISEEEIQELIK